ncbi:hypothetical protein J2X19_000942 [Rhodoferax ferrireducens]|uniref:Glycosyltransferase RgtA/B/C/D-like domain-containing protein n=1 Tax=Rhodoferax ferrireducens TaxID=192843 RepID=A0ABU2C4M4_9BURK|nr:hypothetical protein [Rhodoferax ferrireducens]MDR7376284.1 hypothetical protein [Rhodoferax ferrireducens]
MLWLLVSVVVMLRLYLTGDRNILALNSPHDEYWYIENAFNRVWGGHYNEMTLIHLPVYSAWLTMLKMFGMQARLAIDVGWLLAGGYLAYAIGRLTRSTWTGFVLFAILAFHPYIIRIFDRALAETLLTVLSAAVLAAGIELWNRRAEAPSPGRRLAWVVYGLGFSLAYYTRTEGIVLLAPLCLLACWSLYKRDVWWSSQGRSTQVAPLLALPLVSILFLGGVLSAGNYLKWGVWVSQELAAPGYKSAMEALSSIDTGPTPKQITVTREMMMLAFRESPTFRELQLAMEGDVGQQWVAIAKPYVAAPGEVGNGWFYWALRDVAAHSGWHQNARLAESKYSSVAAELQQAFVVGRLKKRLMIASFVDPDYAKWLPDLPASLGGVARLLVQPKFEYVETPSENASVDQFDRYAAMTGRRGTLPRTAVTGWVVAPQGTLIGLAASNAPPAWQPLGPLRSDVPNAFSFKLTERGYLAFRELVVQMPDGRQGAVDLAALAVGKTATIRGPTPLLLGVDQLEVDTVQQRANRLLPKLASVYTVLGYLCCLFIAVVACYALLVRRQAHGLTPLVFLMGAMIIARIGLLAILDASSWNGTQARYLMPVIPSFMCAGVLSFFVLLGNLKKKL